MKRRYGIPRRFEEPKKSFHSSLLEMWQKEPKSKSKNASATDKFTQLLKYTNEPVNRPYLLQY